MKVTVRIAFWERCIVVYLSVQRLCLGRFHSGTCDNIFKCRTPVSWGVVGYFHCLLSQDTATDRGWCCRDAQQALCAQCLIVQFNLCLRCCSAHSGLLRANSPVYSGSFCWEFLPGADFYQRLSLFFLYSISWTSQTPPQWSLLLMNSSFYVNKVAPEWRSRCSYSDSRGTLRAGMGTALGHLLQSLLEKAQSEGQRGFSLAGHRRTRCFGHCWAPPGLWQVTRCHSKHFHLAPALNRHQEEAVSPRGLQVRLWEPSWSYLTSATGTL